MTKETLRLDKERVPVHERLTPEQLQYLAGIFDASGSITIEKSRTPHGTGVAHTLRLDLEKAQPAIAHSFRDAFPSYSGVRHRPDSQLAHRWYAKSRRAMDILGTLEPYIQLKGPQIEIARKFSETVGNRTLQETEELKEAMRAVNKKPFHLQITELELPYVAGLFDAHGQLYLHDKDIRAMPLPYRDLNASISIACLPLLKQLAKQFDMFPWYREGKAREGVATARSKKAKAFLEKILPFLRAKKQPAEIAIQFQENRKPPFTRKDRWKRVLEEQELERRLKEALYRTIGRDLASKMV